MYIFILFIVLLIVGWLDASFWMDCDLL